MKLRVAVRPQDPATPPAPEPVLPGSPAAALLPEPAVPTEAPLIPIRGLSRVNSSRRNLSPAAQPPAAPLESAVPPISPLAPIAPIPVLVPAFTAKPPVASAADPVLAPLSSLTTPPMMMRKQAATPITPTSTPTARTNSIGTSAGRPTAPTTTADATPDSSSSGVWRVLGGLVLLAILGFVGHSAYKSNQSRQAALVPTEPLPAPPVAPEPVATPPVIPPAVVAPETVVAPTPAATVPSTVPATPPPAAPKPPPPIERPAPSPAFTALLITFKVSGVMQGTPLRAIINGRRIQEGDVVNEQLGVRLIGLDVDGRNLIFEDSTKAQAKLRY